MRVQFLSGARLKPLYSETANCSRVNIQAEQFIKPAYRTSKRHLSMKEGLKERQDELALALQVTSEAYCIAGHIGLSKKDAVDDVANKVAGIGGAALRPVRVLHTPQRLSEEVDVALNPPPVVFKERIRGGEAGPAP